MVFAKHLRLALVGASLLMSFAGQTTAATFPGCVDNCISSSGCRTSNERCMCKEARSVLLDSVISCMFFNCKSDLRNVDETFLGPIEEVCEDVRRIPHSMLEDAEELASSWISKLPAITPPTPKPTKEPEPEPEPETTSQAAPETTEESTPDRTSSAEDGTRPTSSAGTVPLPTNVTTPPPPAAQTTHAPNDAVDSDESESGSESDSDAGFSRNSNTDPFGGGGGSSAAWRTQASFSLLGMPLALLVALAL
ncbi:hypothetical protein VTK26DRAFT_7141 [Humicola hyalothermophila]